MHQQMQSQFIGALYSQLCCSTINGSLSFTQPMTVPLAALATSQSFSTSGQQVSQEPHWNLDLGASHHVTTDANNLAISQPYRGTKN